MLTNRSLLINFLRWFSAMLVLISHIRSVLFEDYQQLNSQSYFLKFFYFITSLGHEAVIVFFVISGYLVGGGIVRKIQASSFQLTDYALKRFSRLYVVLPVALLLTFVFDAFGAYISASKIYEQNTYISSLGYNIVQRLSFEHFASSFFMLQNIVKPPFGSNGPLWSLSYEFWYYVIAGITGAFLSRINDKRFFSAVLLSFLMIALISFLPLVILKYFSIWMLGVMIVVLNYRVQSLRLFYTFCVCLVLYVLILKYGVLPNFFTQFYKDFTLGGLIALTLASIVDKKEQQYGIHYLLSSFSYTLYLIHFPFMLFILALLFEYIGFGIKEIPSVRTFSCFFILTILLMFTSFFLAQYTELKTHLIRKKILRYLRQIRMFSGNLTTLKHK
ncbi:acyltransferase family protein [Rubrolithibacter danxiaensis]|uniref:acyltransferase family protein n=1 Tax=Rubrolithibacter danxiaensis TaxID=3390805 RepID=UPI003BF908A5